MSQVETIFGDVSSTTGLNSDLDNFWQAWDTLSQEPENLPERTTVVETATTLADDLQSTNSQLTTLQGNLNSDISNDVSHINDDLQQIAGLNSTIQSATVAGLSPNDLLDQRDNLLDDLSTYVNAKTVTNPDNTVTLSIGGATVVDGSNATQLVATADSSGNYQVGVSLGGGQSDTIQWSALGGALYGLQQARDVDVQGYVNSLNQLTSTVAGAVNSLHDSRVWSGRNNRHPLLREWLFIQPCRPQPYHGSQYCGQPKYCQQSAGDRRIFRCDPIDYDHSRCCPVWWR